MPLGVEVNLGPDYVVRWGRSFPLKGAQPHVSVHVSCGQTAAWMKTPVGTEVGLAQGHNGTQLPAKWVQ